MCLLDEKIKTIFSSAAVFTAAFEDTLIFFFQRIDRLVMDFLFFINLFSAASFEAAGLVTVNKEAVKK